MTIISNTDACTYFDTTFRDSSHRANYFMSLRQTKFDILNTALFGEGESRARACYRQANINFAWLRAAVLGYKACPRLRELAPVTRTRNRAT